MSAENETETTEGLITDANVPELWGKSNAAGDGQKCDPCWVHGLRDVGAAVDEET